jgi:hypothetical protein
MEFYHKAKNLPSRIKTRGIPKAIRWFRSIAAASYRARQFEDLLELLRANNCSFHSCTALGAAPAPCGVAFRYDIHLRDLKPAHDFLAFHLRENIPATFFLMWDYSNDERKHLEDFLRFAKKVKPPIELGLHDSPVDAYLIETRFSGDVYAYRRWAESDEILSWLESIAAQPDLLVALNADALEHFKSRVRRTREHFGYITTVASHGGQLGQCLRGRMPVLQPPIRALATDFIARNWHTPERVAAAGLDADVESYAKRVPGLKQVSDGGGPRMPMMAEIRRLLAQDSALQLLIHPYIWSIRERS